MTAALLAQTTNTEYALVVAVIMFGLAGVIRIVHDAVDGGLVALGFAFSALAFLVA